MQLIQLICIDWTYFVGYFWDTVQSSIPAMAKSIEDQVRDANGTLTRCAIRVMKGRLYLRTSHAPPKPGEKQSSRVQVALGVAATSAGLKYAIARAQKMESDLLWGRFDWGDWLSGDQKPAKTVGDWVEVFERQWWDKTPKDSNKINYYHKNYELIFNRLPQDELFTPELVRREILANTQPSSRSRKGWAMALRLLGKTAGWDSATLQEISELGKGYSPKLVKPRELPADEEIWDVWESIVHPGWRWIYGVLAVYGLRSHEVFAIEVNRMNEQPSVINVTEGKTGQRIAYPVYGETWTELRPEMMAYPNIAIEGKSHNVLGNKVGQYFREHGIPFQPYDLRHSYARRSFEKGLPSDFIAASMGHSEAVQRSIYRAWWGERPYTEVYNRIMSPPQQQQD